MEEERLYDIGSIELTDLIEQRRMSLGDKNEDYKKLSKEFKKIMDMYPNLQLILEKDRCNVKRSRLQNVTKVGQCIFRNDDV